MGNLEAVESFESNEISNPFALLISILEIILNTREAVDEFLLIELVPLVAFSIDPVLFFLKILE